ncbi:MAG: signal recognition particle protein [Proteobacteria bacterium]|nr:signal recognition particle protein [Pseudomonadota bacterium]
MFENLNQKLSKTFKKLTNKGVLSDTNISASLKEVKLALLEADVNYRVVNSFLRAVKKRALGTEVMGSLSPGQQFIKIVNDELVNMMGSENHDISHSLNQLNIIMMVGLQGSGKTTTAAKLANRLKKDSKKVHLVSVDVYRPAAIDQLQTLAKDIDVHCYPSDPAKTPKEIALGAKAEAEQMMADFLILDTAGRLQIDEKLMNELVELKASTQLKEILFVADAMTGQEAVNVAKAFHDKLEISGFILSKMDGDARGGAALSIRAITGQPVKFIGIGEKIKDLEPFYPDRIASRILGMGDLVGLLEKAHEHFDQAEVDVLEEKIRRNSFTLADFQDQLKQIRKMGSLGDILGMIPGVGSKLPANASIDDKNLVKIDAIISSMTKKEKITPNIINGARKLRISKGSGTQVTDVNRLLKQFAQMRKMMKKFSSMGNNPRAMKSMQNMMGSGGFGQF